MTPCAQCVLESILQRPLDKLRMADVTLPSPFEVVGFMRMHCAHVASQALDLVDCTWK